MKSLFNTERRTMALSSGLAAATIGTAFLASHAALAQPYTLTTLASFNGTNGADIYGGMTLDGSGNLYGASLQGGASGDGTVFEIAAGTNTITTLATFNGTNGENPAAALTPDSSGNLYGTTEYGGGNGDGTVFEIAAGTKTLTTLATFNGTDGKTSNGALTFDSSGNLYGTTYAGGTNSVGSVFEIAAGTNTITSLGSFNGTNGKNPIANVILDSSGNLFGTTTGGGANNDGAVFEIAAGTATITTLVSFNGTNGQILYGGLTIDSKGDLYGTAQQGGANGTGTVFEIAAGTNTITTLATFNNTNGAYSDGSLLLDSSGNLFGTTAGGGASGDGTVFEMAAGTTTITTLASLNGTDGNVPAAGLTLDSSGDLYGSTVLGGANNDGTVFELKPAGSASAPEPGTVLMIVPGLAALTLTAAVRRRRVA